MIRLATETNTQGNLYKRGVFFLWLDLFSSAALTAHSLNHSRQKPLPGSLGLRVKGPPEFAGDSNCDAVGQQPIEKGDGSVRLTISECNTLLRRYKHS